MLKVKFETLIHQPETINRDLVKILVTKFEITEQIWDKILGAKAMELFIDSKYYGNSIIPASLLDEAVREYNFCQFSLQSSQ